MEPTEGSETSAELKRMPGIYPKERIQYLKPDESLKSRRQAVLAFQESTIAKCCMKLTNNRKLILQKFGN